MLYSDLVQFDPIESVIQLRDADRAEDARRLVATFVISDQMADRMVGIVLPQLGFESGTDNRGLLIVGNYGTGKSHLMSVISAVAAEKSLLPQLSNDRVRAAAEPIAGRFKVLRTELGATKMPFRDFVCSELQRALNQWGVEYAFPPQEKLGNHKAAFEDMMALFAKKHPDQGILMIVDELLDYLRTRRDEEQLLDLGFLRELGEICKNLRFRFMAGLQEMLFENPRFAYVAEPLRRVKDRFEQVLIERSDVEFVVQERLLKKSAVQLGKVEEHLRPYSKYYGDMSSRLERFSGVFPIHPEFVGVFERMAIGEKREVLKALTGLIKAILPMEVPTDAPGIISFDAYWEVLCKNPALRSITEDVRKVVETSATLEDIVARNLKPKSYLPMARRAVHALSVHRLTTGDIRKKVGMTPEALRDALCLYDQGAAELGGDPSEDLLAHVETVLKTVMKTVSGQFLTHNKDNGQFYLDVEKTEDYDAQIEKRADSLGSNTRNRAYHEALKIAMEVRDAQPYVSGARIWLHELEWRDRKAGRLGYLFFGAPNERTTAQPPREFYVYFVQAYDPPKFKDEHLPDEVFFKLAEPDAEFDQACSYYAAALELATSSSGEGRARFERKADEYLGQLTRWISKNLASAFVVVHQGVSKRVGQLLKGGGGSMNVRQAFNEVAASCLAGRFQEIAPDYPTFKVSITKDNRAQNAVDAIRWIRGTKTYNGASVLDSLELLDGENIDVAGSRYAQHISKALTAKPSGQVVNRSELIDTIAETFEKVEYMDPKGMRLEPELVVVLLAALVYNGDVVLAISGEKFDSGKLDALATTDIKTLVAFKHIERPKDWDLPALRDLFKMLGLAPGEVQFVQQMKPEPVRRLQENAQRLVEGLVQAIQIVSGGFMFWGEPLKTPDELEKMRASLHVTKEFLESLQAYNTPEKLKNFKSTPQEIRDKQPGLDVRCEVEALSVLIGNLSEYALYLGSAELALPEAHHWRTTVKNAKVNIISDLKESKKRAESDFMTMCRQQLQSLKASYATEYRAIHDRARLNSSDDQKKAKLIHDPRLGALRQLRTIEHLPSGKLDFFEERLTKLRTCFSLTEKELQANPLCPHCQLNPSSVNLTEASAGTQIAQLADELDKMLESWSAQLLDMLSDPTTEGKLKLLEESRQKRVREFMKKKQLPHPLEAEFVIALGEALSDLKRVVVRADELKKALAPEATALRVEKLRANFEKFIADRTKGMEPDKIRIIIE